MSDKKIDCLLVNAPDSQESSHYVADPKIPLGLLYIANAVRISGASVRILDYHAAPTTQPNIIQTLKKMSPRVVGLNISTPNRFIVFNLARLIKKIDPLIKIVVGGPHATCLPSDILKNAPEIDAVCIGEGELSFPKFLSGLSKSDLCNSPSVHGIVSSSNSLELPQRIVDLDSLPFPAYDLIDMKRYMAVTPELYLVTSRGCKFNCAFCCSQTIFNGSVISRSYLSVLSELYFLKNTYGASHFYFYDDNFLAWPHLQRFCEKLLGRDITWFAQANINNVEPELCDIISYAGCRRLSFGFESGSPKVQNYIGKIISNDVPRKIVQLVKRNIESRGFFIVGLPKEELYDLLLTTRMIIRLKLAGMTDISIFPARPFPGTRLFVDCEQQIGETKTEELLKYEYIDDYNLEPDPYIRLKLQRYNILPVVNINKKYERYAVREIIKRLYRVFLNAEIFDRSTDRELSDFLFDNL